MINVTTLTSSRTLIPRARRPADSHVACYPPDFSAAHVGVLSVFVSSSAHEAPELVGTPSSLLYVSNTACAAKCVIAGIGLSAGKNECSLMVCVCVCVFVCVCVCVCWRARARLRVVRRVSFCVF